MGCPMIENMLEVGHPTPSNMSGGMSHDCKHTRGGTFHTIKYTRWDVPCLQVYYMIVHIQEVGLRHVNLILVLSQLG